MRVTQLSPMSMDQTVTYVSGPYRTPSNIAVKRNWLTVGFARFQPAPYAPRGTSSCLMLDDQFFDRADAHIHLSNSQISEKAGRGKVSASFMYAVARFNAWVSACGWDSAEEMAAAKEETVDYFVAEYRKMLEENVEDYISNFDSYMKQKDGNA